LDACEETCIEGTIAEVPPDREQPRQGAEARSFSHSTLVTDARESGNKEQPEQETEVKPFPLFTLAADALDRLLPKPVESQ